MLLVVMLFGMAAALLVYGMVDTTSIALRRDSDVAVALAQAKQALIGRAVADDTRPGSLPCPDTDNDGSAELFVGNDCPSYIGRLPWKTLGLPDLRDDAGERLWYALSNNFRDDMSAGPLNSDTKGNRTVYSESSAVTITAEAVAVIFAPGPILAGQLRDTATNQNIASNYLDSTGGANNATTTGPYISAQRSNTFNDRLLVITTAELMPPVERRVARDVIAILKSYKTATAALGYNGGAGAYPWPDLSTGFSDFGLNRGRIPGYESVGVTSPPYALPVDWGVGGAPTLPQWFIDNQWRRIIYYAVGKNFLESNGAGCTSCEVGQIDLSVGGVWGKEVVLLTPGPAGASRPVAYPWTDWVPYLDDAENNDNANDRYVTPSSSAYARDRIFTIP